MREEYADPATPEETNLAMLKDARDADLESAVRREVTNAKAKGFALDDAAAKQQVIERIGTEGVNEILPQYARIRTRLGISADVELDERPARSRVRTSTRVGEDSTTVANNIVDGHDLERMESTIQRAIANGEDASDSIALLKYLKAKAE